MHKIMILEKICEAFDFYSEDLHPDRWGSQVTKAVQLLSNEDTVTAIMANMLVAAQNEGGKINTEAIQWCTENNVELSAMSKLNLMLMRPGWTPQAEITILNMTFLIGTDEHMDVTRELYVEPTTIRYGATYRIGKDGDQINVDFEYHNNDHKVPARFSFPATVTIQRIPGIDSDNFHHDECWQQNYEAAPVEEHAEECEYRKWRLGDYGDNNGEVCEHPECECDFDCCCDPSGYSFKRVVNNDEFFSEEFLRWYAKCAL